MAKKPTHTHKLRRHKYPSGNAVFFCTLPDCHYKIDAQLVIGKRALCNICGDEFIMNEYTIKLKSPHCDGCGKVKVKGSDGKSRFVRKVTNKALIGMAENSNESLRSRLDSVINESEKDI